jgi:hypothetical protein
MHASQHPQTSNLSGSFGGANMCPGRVQFAHMSYYPVFEILLRSVTPIIAQGCDIIAHVFQELPIEPYFIYHLD